MGRGTGGWIISASVPATIPSSGSQFTGSISVIRDVVHIGKANHSDHQNEYLRPGDHSAADEAEANAGSGRIDHVCFNCFGIVEFAERLDRNGIKYNERQAHDQSLYQLFFMEPINGIKVELNFPAEEAAKAGRSPTLTATGATE